MDRVNELIKRVRLLRPIDDAMFKKLAESRAGMSGDTKGNT